MNEIEAKLPQSTIVELNESDLTELLSINVLCRLCASQNDKLIGIYNEEGIYSDLASKINLYLPIKVNKTDQLPLQCCWRCASTILAWHELVVSCVQADRKLRSYPILPEKQFLENVGLEQEQPIVEDSESKTQLGLEQKFPDIKSTEEEQLQQLQRENTVYLPTSELSNLREEDDEEMLLNDFKHNVTDDWGKLEDQTDGVESEPSKILSQLNKDGRKHTKLDQELVNEAKVVVDGRVYYNCKQCGKSLHSPYTYVWHMRIHTGERPFVCDLCGKQFRVSQGLVRHLKETHARIKNFACDLCGRMFATRRNVEEHRRIHTNERPYICDLCGKAFKQKASLFVHNRSHTDSFPFKCSYCNQGFRTKPPLLIHVTRHTGEKPFPCEVCGRCFRIKYELKRHMLVHSEEKPFTCSLCGLSFRQKRYLKNHNKSNHQNRVT